MLGRTARAWLAYSMVGLTVAACAATGPSGGNGGGSGSNGSGGSGGLAGGSGGLYVGPGSASGGLGESGSLSDASSGDACQHFDVQFLPKIPLVYVLADRSGSVFLPTKLADGGTVAEWDALRVATLAVVQNLQAQVAFGFGAYTGYAAGMMCPILDQAPTISLNNYAPIQTLYQSLGMPTFKAETPAQMAMELVSQKLAAAAAQPMLGSGQPGGQYILFVTDGETDFCDDGNALCPADAVVAELQKLYGQGIQTLILGVGSSLTSISTSVLQAFANAGAGIGTPAPPLNLNGPPATGTDIYQQCSSVHGWNVLSTAAGHAMNTSLATYAVAAPTTNAKVYSPDVTNVDDLTKQLGAALETVKSCSFDLQGKITVDLSRAGEGRVTIDGTDVPFDAMNGWKMSKASQLDLVGSACDTWRSTGTDIAFNFPCDVIIPPPR